DALLAYDIDQLALAPRQIGNPALQTATSLRGSVQRNGDIALDGPDIVQDGLPQVLYLLLDQLPVRVRRAQDGLLPAALFQQGVEALQEIGQGQVVDRQVGRHKLEVFPVLHQKVFDA